MKKRKLIGAILCSACLIIGSAVPAMADAMKVVTLGADLSAEQQQRMLNYFKVDTNEAQIMYITNADAANASILAQETGLENTDSRLVFLTEFHDTRFDAYSVQSKIGRHSVYCTYQNHLPSR